jgi:hypothetical protein
MHEFIQQMYLRNAINAALQRANVYSDDVTGEQKTAFKRDCSQHLADLGRRYFAWEHDLESFCAEVQRFSATLSQDHADTLVGHHLRIGIAQKMVSLYLKYLWLAGDCSKKPAAAVLDRGILEASGFHPPPNWTEMDDFRQYQDIQAAIQQRAEEEGFGSAAVWEAERWNEDDELI